MDDKHWKSRQVSLTGSRVSALGNTDGKGHATKPTGKCSVRLQIETVEAPEHGLRSW